MQTLCAVTGCRNTSSKSKGIVLHKLPEQPEVRAAWLRVIPTQSKSKRLVVCSKHFQEEDFSMPAGLAIIRRLKQGAIPAIFPTQQGVTIKKKTNKKGKVLLQDEEKESVCNEVNETCDKLADNKENNFSNNVIENFIKKEKENDSYDYRVPTLANNFESNESSTTEFATVIKMEKRLSECTVAVCRLCLLQTDKLFNMDKHKLRVHYEELLSGPMADESRMPQTMCSVCVRLLGKCVDFKQKCERAHQLLEELTNDGQQITEEKLNRIDRDKEGFVRHKMSVQLVDEIVDVDKTDVVTNNDNTVEQLETSFVNWFAVVKGRIIDNDISQPEIKKEIIDEDSEHHAIKTEIDVPYFDNHNYDFNMENNYFNENTNDKFEGNDCMDIENFTRNYHHTENNIANAENATASHSPVVQQKAESMLPTNKPILLEHEPLNRNLWKVFKESKEAILKDKEIRRVSENFRMSAYKCHLCVKGFLKHEVFEIHKRFHYPDRGEAVCEYCQLRFETPQLKATHVDHQHSYSYHCRHCDFRCTTSLDARRHDIDHEEFFYTCEVCSQDFRMYTAYMSHKRSHPDSAHVCPGCGENFISELTNLQHFRHMHPYLTWPQSVKSSEDPLYCRECDMHFLAPEAFTMHLLTSLNHADVLGNCTKLKPFLLDSKASKINSPIETECPLCGVVCASNVSYLQHHRRAHAAAGVPPTGRFQCDTCGKKLISNFQLKHHSLQHTGAMPYACQLCPRRFNLKSNLVRHTRLHTGLRLFACEHCDKRFTAKADLCTHVRHVHQRVPWPKRQRARNRARKPDLARAQ